MNIESISDKHCNKRETIIRAIFGAYTCRRFFRIYCSERKLCKLNNCDDLLAVSNIT